MVENFFRKIKCINLFISFLIFTFSGFYSLAQGSNTFEKFLERYQAYRSILSIEKVYLHINKTEFYPWQDLLFAAHLIGDFSEMSAPKKSSTTGYVELIDPTDSIIIRKPIHFDNKISYGQISLDSLPVNEVYRLRAYTNWMRNLGPSTFYEQAFAVIDGNMRITTETPALSTRPEIDSPITLIMSNPIFVQLLFESGEKSATDYLLLLEAQQEIVWSGILKTLNGKAAVAIPKSRIPYGYFRAVILNKRLEKVAQSININSYKSFQHDLQLYPEMPEKRSKHNLTISLTDQKKEPVQGHFSINIVATDHQNIPKPGIYEFFGQIYSNRDRSGRSYDLNWLPLNDEFAIDPERDYFFKEDQMKLLGKALKPNGKPAGNTTINLLINASNPYLGEFTTDKNGFFYFKNLYFEDYTDLILSDIKNRRLEYEIYPLWIKPAPVGVGDLNFNLKPTWSKNQDNLALDMLKYLEKQSDIMVLEEIEIKGLKKREDIRKGVVRLYGKSDYTLDSEKINFNSGIYADVFQVVAGRVSSYIPPPAGGEAGTFQRTASLGRTTVPPLCLLNGVPTDCISLKNIPVNLVSSIDVTPGAQNIFGGIGANGMIAVYTIFAESGNAPDIEVDPSAYAFSLEGYHPKERPKMPNYSEPLPEHFKPDYRETIFWNPSTYTDESGKLSISFYMNDKPKLNYIIEVEGVDNSGRFISLRQPIFTDQ